MKNPDYLFLWARLTDIVREGCAGLPVIVDELGALRIETEAGRPFAIVRIQLRHVGLYLLPLYYHPHTLPDRLAPRRHGAATLRFTEEEDPLIGDVASLIERCLSTIGHY